VAEYNAFDIIGPIMIGPSSSHTAGAARLGLAANRVAGGPIQSVRFLLHGSFAKTYKGHGTDRALLAGVLGYSERDDSLRDAMNIAQDRAIEYSFEPLDMGDVHPNSVKIEMTLQSGECVSLSGSSIGGGSIRIWEVNGFSVDMTGEKPVLLTRHRDREGVISGVTRILATLGINIVSLNCSRKEKRGEASMVVELDEMLDDRVLEVIKERVVGIEAISVIDQI
jgi:L-serine dehydratase